MHYEIQEYFMQPLRHISRYRLILDNVANRVHMATGKLDVGIVTTAQHLALRFSQKADAVNSLTERADTLVKLFKVLVSYVTNSNTNYFYSRRGEICKP